MATVINGVRFSYAKVFTPDPETDKYEVSLLIPDDAEKTLDDIEDAIEEAFQYGKTSGKFAASVQLDRIKTPLKNGDELNEQREGEGKDANPEQAGHYVLNARSKTKPGVVNAQLQPIIDPAEFYSGCYGAASVSFYPYNHPTGGLGIGVGLNHLMKTKDGDKLSAGQSAEEAFADLAVSPAEGAAPRRRRRG